MRWLLAISVVSCVHAQINFPPDLTVSRVEVVQTVQDEDQTVPLTAGKATAVRAFVRQAVRLDPLVANVQVLLRGFRNGIELERSPLRPINSPITASLNPDRANVTDSQDFILPSTWTTAGRLELRAQLQLAAGTVEAPADNNTTRREVEFLAPAFNELRVAWLPVCVATDACRSNAFPHQTLAERLLPIGDGTLRYDDVPTPPLVILNGPATDVSAQALLAPLKKWRLFLDDSPLRPSFLVGWLPQDTRSYDYSAKALGDKAGWIVQHADPRFSERLLMQQLSNGPLTGGCETVIAETAYDPVSARLVPASRNSASSRCDQAQGTPWFSVADAKAALLTPDAPARGAASQVLIISGSVRRDGTGKLDRAYRMQSAAPLSVADASGDACLVVGGEAPFCFQSVRDGGDESSFAFRLASPANPTQIRLTVNGNDVASMNATGTAPSVTITSVREGEIWTGTKNLEWTGTDSSGRALSYSAFYSADDGATWIPLAIDTPTPAYPVDTRYLLQGRVKFRIMASAGLDSTIVESASVQIPQSPRLQLPETLLNFGSATVGQIAERGFVMQNPGTGPLDVRVTAAPGEAFLASTPVPLRIRAGTERLLPMRFLPRTPGTETSEIAFGTNDPANVTAGVALRASAFERAVPSASVSLRNLDFGQVSIGQTRELTFVIRNDGTAALIVSSLSTLNSRFNAVSPTGQFTVAPGEERVIMTRFAPLADGPQVGTLNIATNDPSSLAIQINLRGAGFIVTTPAVEVFPSSVDFGRVTLSLNSSQNVTVRNSGTGNLVLQSASTDNAAFVVTAPTVLPVTIAPAASATVTVRFTPPSANSFTATLTVSSNDPEKGAVRVPLSGSGVTQAPSLVPRITMVTPTTLRPVGDFPEAIRKSLGYNVTVYGENFGNDARVLWNGEERKATLITSNRITFPVSTADVESPSRPEISVVNPPPGGGTSAKYSLLAVSQPPQSPIATIHESNLANCPTITSTVSVPNVAGLPITTLTANNISCTEDGTSVPCTIRRGLDQGIGLSVMMVLQTSTNPNRDKQTRDRLFIQRVANRLIDNLGPTTRTMIAYMDNGVRVADSTQEFKETPPPGGPPGALRDAVSGILTQTTGAGNALYDGIDFGLRQLTNRDRLQTGRRKALVVFTSEGNTYNIRVPIQLNELLGTIQNLNVPIFLVPVGDGQDSPALSALLQQIATDSNGRVISDIRGNIGQLMDLLPQELDNQPLVDFTSQKADGQPHRYQIDFQYSGSAFSTLKAMPGCPAR